MKKTKQAIGQEKVMMVTFTRYWETVGYAEIESRCNS
jgi:hypothetical protein